MAKWTLNDFIYHLRRRIDEEDQDYFNDTELTAYLNEAILKMSDGLKKEAIGELELAEAKQTIDFREIFIPEEEKEKTVITDRRHNFFQLRTVYLDDEKLRASTLEEVEAGNGGFFIWGENLDLGKKKTGNVRAYYIKRPRTLVNTTDTTEIPEQYQDIPLEYAIAKCKQKDGDYGLYDYSLNQFFMMVENMKREIRSQERSSGVSNIAITDYNWG